MSDLSASPTQVEVEVARVVALERIAGALEKIANPVQIVMGPEEAEVQALELANRKTEALLRQKSMRVEEAQADQNLNTLRSEAQEKMRIGVEIQEVARYLRDGLLTREELSPELLEVIDRTRLTQEQARVAKLAERNARRSR